jgi:hypothetical protein
LSIEHFRDGGPAIWSCRWRRREPRPCGQETRKRIAEGVRRSNGEDALRPYRRAAVLRLRYARDYRRLSSVVSSSIPKANHGIRLGTFLTFDYVEFDLIAFLERFVSVQLDCRVVNEYIWPVVASDESVALGVVEPLDLSLVLSHRFLPSLYLWRYGGLSFRGNSTPCYLRRRSLAKG